VTNTFSNLWLTFLSEGKLQILFSWLAGLSLATFLLSLLFIPLLISKLDANCFLLIHTAKNAPPERTFLRFFASLLRNLLGLILFFAGVAMLFLPGQGLLTMLLGILLLSIPGKQRLITSLTRGTAVRQSLDWLRKKAGKEPFRWPDRTQTPPLD